MQQFDHCTARRYADYQSLIGFLILLGDLSSDSRLFMNVGSIASSGYCWGPVFFRSFVNRSKWPKSNTLGKNHECLLPLKSFAPGPSLWAVSVWTTQLAHAAVPKVGSGCASFTHPENSGPNLEENTCKMMCASSWTTQCISSIWNR